MEWSLELEVVLLWQLELAHARPQLLDDSSGCSRSHELGRNPRTVDFPGQEDKDQIPQENEGELPDQLELELVEGKVVQKSVELQLSQVRGSRVVAHQDLIA